MRQRARVIEVHGKTATVSVSRRTMCEGCEKSGGCGGHCHLSGIIASENTVRAEALNPVGANPGEIVEVESDGTRVLGYAALVFLLPIGVCALFWLLGSRLFGEGLPGVIAAAVGFVLTFLGIAVFDRSLREKTPRITIVSRVTEREDEDV
ncbi:MAG: SoxR reducing system RseC family protein [Clostridia bacterium]|nr:SoxR reducing system RseC family protein [Clostridia bacterium]